MSRHKLTHQLVNNRIFEWRFNIKIATIQYIPANWLNPCGVKTKSHTWNGKWVKFEIKSIPIIKTAVFVRFWTISFSACDLQFVIYKRRGQALSEQQKKSWPYFFHPIFFSVKKPTQVFKAKISHLQSAEKYLIFLLVLILNIFGIGSFFPFVEFQIWAKNTVEKLRNF